MKIIIPLYFTIFLLTMSCSDNSTKTNEVFNYKEYMPLDSSNYWEYKYYGIDKNGEHYLSEYAFDSVFVKDTIYYRGRNALLMGANDNTQGKISDYEFYYSLDSSQISMIGFPLQVSDSIKFENKNWVILYDLYRGIWSSQYISFNDSIIDGSKYNGAISFEGSDRGDTKIEFEGVQVNALSTFLKIIYNLEKTTGNKTTQIKIFEDYEFEFAKDIGLVYSKYQKYQDSVLIGGYEKVISGYGK